MCTIIILLNKTDLVEPADLDLLEVKIRDIKKDARIIRTRESQVALPLILSVGLFESDKYFESTQAERNEYLSREQFTSIPWRHGLP